MPNSLTSGTASSSNIINVSALDASGATIIGSTNYSNGPIVMTSDFAGITALTSLANPTSITTFSYNGAAIVNNAQHIIATVGSITTSGTIPVLVIGGNGTIFVANAAASNVLEYIGSTSTPSKTLTGLNGPFGVAVDANGTVYVTNSGSVNTVSEFLAGAITPTASKTLTGLSNPQGVAVDASGTVYVSNTNAGTISEFIGGATTPSKTITGLSSPEGIAVDTNGTIYIASYAAAGTVSEFIGGAVVASKILTGLNYPEGVAVDTNGTVYVTNFGGTTVSEFVGGSTTPSTTKILTGLNSPRGIAVDAAGTVYVSNSGGTTVSEFVGGATIASVTLTGLSTPLGVAILPNIAAPASVLNVMSETSINPTTFSGISPYAVTSTNSSVLQVQAVQNSWGTAAGHPFTVSANTCGTSVVVTSTGTDTFTLTSGGSASINCAVTIAAGYGVSNVINFTQSFVPPTMALNVVSASNITQTTFSGNGPYGVSLTTPGSSTLTVTAVQSLWGSTYGKPFTISSNTCGSKVVVSNTSGDTFALSSASTTIPSCAITFTGAYGVSDILYYTPQTLYVINGSYGNVLTEFLPGATTPYKTVPITIASSAIAIDNNGNIYTANNIGAGQVYEYTVGGSQLSITTPGINSPYALAVDKNGTLYVPRTSYSQLLEFPAGATTPSTTLTLPSISVGGIAVDASGTVYNSVNGTVAKFPVGYTTPTSTLTNGLSGPDGLAFDTNGTLYVVNTGNKTIAEFPSGTTTPSKTLFTSGLTGIRSVAVDASGTVYVSDASDGEVIEFVGGATTPSIIITGLIYPGGIAVH